MHHALFVLLATVLPMALAKCTRTPPSTLPPLPEAVCPDYPQLAPVPCACGKKACTAGQLCNTDYACARRRSVPIRRRSPRVRACVEALCALTAEPATPTNPSVCRAARTCPRRFGRSVPADRTSAPGRGPAATTENGAYCLGRCVPRRLRWPGRTASVAPVRASRARYAQLGRFLRKKMCWQTRCFLKFERKKDL